VNLSPLGGKSLRVDRASTHREELPPGGVSNGETAPSRPPQEEENRMWHHDYVILRACETIRENWFHAPSLDPIAVIPAKAGIHRGSSEQAERWIPAFAGMTPEWVVLSPVPKAMPGFFWPVTELQGIDGADYVPFRVACTFSTSLLKEQQDASGPV